MVIKLRKKPEEMPDTVTYLPEGAGVYRAEANSGTIGRLEITKKGITLSTAVKDIEYTSATKKSIFKDGHITFIFGLDREVKEIQVTHTRYTASLPQKKPVVIHDIFRENGEDFSADYIIYPDSFRRHLENLLKCEPIKTDFRMAEVEVAADCINKRLREKKLI